MRRRDFITLVGGAATGWPLAVRAQQGALPVIGLLHPGSPEANARYVAGFRKGLTETGYVEGRNVSIEYRWGHGEVTRLSELAADLVKRAASVIVTPGGVAAALAAKAATATIPIVFVIGVDPVQSGLVVSLNRPGGNVTGISLHEFGPCGQATWASTSTVAAGRAFCGAGRFQQPANSIGARRCAGGGCGHGASARHRHRHDQPRNHPGVQRGSAESERRNIDSPDPLFTSRPVQLATLAARHAMPAIYALREFAEGGGLISYGSNFTDMFRQAGTYVVRILKSEKPADLPILQATKFELVINLQTAEAFGLDAGDAARACRRGDRSRRRQAKLARSAGASPAQVRRSEPPGSECCVSDGNGEREAYTAVAGGVEVSHEMGVSQGRRLSLGRTQHERCRYASHVVPSGRRPHHARKDRVGSWDFPRLAVG